MAQNNFLRSEKIERGTFQPRYGLEHLPGISESGLVFEQLDISYLPQIIKLEPIIYPKGWSESLIRAEFDKHISFRPSIIHEKEVLAYSFNYIIEDELHILNLAVRPDVQQRGLGTLLLKSLLEGARSRGVRYAFLEVRKSNVRAQSMYFRAGFSSSGIRREYYSDNREDAVLMELYF